MKSISFPQQSKEKKFNFSINKLMALLFVLLSFVSFNETKAQSLTKSANFSAVVLPRYMGSGTSTRLPVMFKATISGLTANTQYRYITGMATTNTTSGGSADIGTTNIGAGNPLYYDSTTKNFTYSSSASLTVAGGYGTFTANASGVFTGWFGVVNTGNGRFTAGNNCLPSIQIGSSTGTSLFRYAMNDSIKVLGYVASAGANNGSFIKESASGATAKNIVALWDTINPIITARPLSTALVEYKGLTGTAVASLVPTYDSAAGSWNSILPNGTSGFGLKKIEQYDINTGNLLCAAVNSSNYASTATATGATAITVTSSNVSLASLIPTVSAVITTGSQSSCVATTVGFTATPTNAGTSSSYQWKLNNANAGTNATTYSSSSFANNDAVYVVMTPGTNVCVTNIAPQSSTTTLTRNAYLTPSVAITVDDSTAFPGQTLTFTAVPTNGGTATYQWFVDGSLVNGETAATYVTNTIGAGSHTVYVILTPTNGCFNPTTATSRNQTLVVDGSACSGTPNTGTTNATLTNVCNGGSTTLSLTGLGTTTNISYQWQTATTQTGTYSNVGVTTATYTPTITTALWYRCVVTCDNSGLSTPSTAIQINVAANLTPTVSIASSASPACENSSVTFTATPTNGGASPSYAWYKNTVLVSGVTTATYTSSSFADGDQVYAILTSNYVCVTTPTATSNTATQSITANVTASVSITSSANPSCANASVTFTATPINGGNTPTYQWYNNNVAINLETASTYTTSSLTNGASIKVILTSSVTCVTGSPATSNAVVQAVSANLTPAVTIASSNPIICNSGGTTFAATPTNGGSSPVYAWYLNGSLVSGETAVTYALSSVTNGDAVYATLTSNASCLTTNSATSSTITESVTTPQIPTVAVTSNPSAVSGIVSVHNGSNVTFTATPTFGGTAPTYQWKLNGTNISGATASTYSTTTLSNNDVVSCAIVSNYACLTTATASGSLSVAIISNSPFTPGNIIIYRSGDGASSLVNTGNAVYLDEYTQSGTFVQSARLTKATTSASSLSIVSSGTASSEGGMTLNTNGLNIAVPGYYAYTGYATSITGTASATVNRVCALVDMNQNVDTTTRLSDWSTANNARGVVANGNSIYVVGGAGGIRYAAKGATTSTQLSTTTTNLRVANIFNGQLYVSASSGATRLAAVGAGVPTTNGQTISNLTGTDIPALSSPYSYFFASSSVLYVADDNSKSTTIKKFVLSSGNWVAAGTLALDTAARGLTGYVSGGNVILFASTGGSNATGGMNAIYKIIESLSTSTITSSYTKIVNVATANNFIAFRGICFAPTSIATQPVNTSVCAGAATSFSVIMTSGANAVYAYQWQLSSDNGSTWNNLSNSGAYTNAATATLSILNSTGLNNTQYRCLVTYMGSSVLTSNAAVLTVPTTTTPIVSIATATDTVCSGNAVMFTATGVNAGTGPVYTWYKNANSVGTGSTITFPGGTLTNGDVISCVLTANNACQTTATANSNTHTLTVKTSPAIGTTTGFTTCVTGSVIGIYNTNPFNGGVWSSSNTAVATVTTSTTGGGTGLVVPVANGTSVLTFSKTSSNGCVSSASANVIVAVAITPNAITGINSVCKGNTTQLSTTSTGGVWNTVTTSYATVNSTGLVTSTNAGNAIIKYTVTNASGCSASASYTVAVHGFPVTPAIGYQSGTPNPQYGPGGGFCANKTFTVAGTPSGGVWSKTGVIAVGTSSGIVNTGSIAGSATLTYTYTDGFGCSSSRTIIGNVVVCASRGVTNNQSINQSTNQEFTMYPNPAKTFIRLNVERLMGTGSIVVTDLYGKQAKVQSLSMGTNTIDIANLSKGVYFVSTITNEGKTTKKLVLE